MSHSSTELLIDYWQSRISDGEAPTRASIDPTDFPTILPQVFMLGRRAPGDYIFRLAGGLLGEIHKLDLRGVCFTDLWAQNARKPIQIALESARHCISPVRIVAEAQAGPTVLGLNIVLLPLSTPPGQVDRFLGMYETTAPLSRLGGLPAHRLQLVTLGAQTMTTMDEPRIRLAAVGGLRVG